jgi:hypothetical protein
MREAGQWGRSGLYACGVSKSAVQSRWVRVALALAFLLGIAGCETDGGDHASITGQRASSSSEDACASLLSRTYDKVINAKQVSGSGLKAWLIARSNGPYSPTQIESIPDTASVTVCEMHSSTLAPPAPGAVEVDAAIVWIGIGSTPTVDAMSSQAKLSALMSTLS